MQPTDFVNAGRKAANGAAGVYLSCIEACIDYRGAVAKVTRSSTHTHAVRTAGFPFIVFAFVCCPSGGISMPWARLPFTARSSRSGRSLPACEDDGSVRGSSGEADMSSSLLVFVGSCSKRAHSELKHLLNAEVCTCPHSRTDSVRSFSGGRRSERMFARVPEIEAARSRTARFDSIRSQPRARTQVGTVTRVKSKERRTGDHLPSASILALGCLRSVYRAYNGVFVSVSLKLCSIMEVQSRDAVPFRQQ